MAGTPGNSAAALPPFMTRRLELWRDEWERQQAAKEAQTAAGERMITVTLPDGRTIDSSSSSTPLQIATGTALH
jgi:hypothetical protein